jgi:hypothetical protein
MTEYPGRCHCGALQVTYRTNIDPAHWPLRHDGCSFCRRHCVVASSDPAGEIAFEFRDPSKVSRYRFGQKTAEFLICRECGIFVAALCGSAGAERAVVNTRVFEDVLLDYNNVVLVHFDDETPVQRAERRSRHWTPVRTAAVVS